MLMVVVGLFLVIAVVGGGYMFNAQIIGPRNTQIANLKLDEDKDEKALADIEKSVPRLKKLKQMSLPGDPDVAQQTYAKELGDMLRNSEFSADKTQIIAKPIENRAAIPAAKRLPYTRLTFDVTTHGDLAALVDFLDRFYRLPLMHRIRNLGIVRPVTLQQQQGKYELDINFLIEALIVDGAEKRPTLLPKGVTIDKPKLPRTSGQYAMIAGKNIFYGPPPAAITYDGPKDPLGGIDQQEYVRLNMINIEEKNTFAEIYDVVFDYTYHIQQQADGSFKVTSFYRDKSNRKRPLGESKNLDVKDDEDQSIAIFKVALIGVYDLILESGGKYYRMNLGDSLRDLRSLKADELTAMGLGTKDKKADKDPKKDPGKTDKDPKKDGDKKDTEATKGTEKSDKEPMTDKTGDKEPKKDTPKAEDKDIKGDVEKLDKTPKKEEDE
jgi:hypothetical protein